MVCNFTVSCTFYILIFKVFFTNITDYCIFIKFLLFFVNNFTFFFLKLSISIACSLMDSKNIFIQSLSLCTLCLFSILLNEDIVDIEKPDRIFSITFVMDKFSGLFYIQQSFLLNIQDLRK